MRYGPTTEILGMYTLRSFLVLLVISISPMAHSLGDATGHQIGNGKTKTEACSGALSQAETATAAVATYGKKHVNIQNCDCEEDHDAADWKRWSCIVRWAVTDLGR